VGGHVEIVRVTLFLSLNWVLVSVVCFSTLSLSILKSHCVSFFFFAVREFELRASHFLDKVLYHLSHSTKPFL
jgi:hypothetical protein